MSSNADGPPPAPVLLPLPTPSLRPAGATRDGRIPPPPVPKKHVGRKLAIMLGVGLAISTGWGMAALATGGIVALLTTGALILPVMVVTGASMFALSKAYGAVKKSAHPTPPDPWAERDQQARRGLERERLQAQAPLGPSLGGIPGHVPSRLGGDSPETPVKSWSVPTARPTRPVPPVAATAWGVPADHGRTGPRVQAPGTPVVPPAAEAGGPSRVRSTPSIT